MDNFIRTLDGTMLASVRDDLKKYIQINPFTKFFIFSDYCLDDKNKPNKVASFTIVPYDFEFSEYSEHIHRIAPNDIKGSRSIKSGFLEHIAENRLFHLSCVFENLSGLTSNGIITGREHVLQSIDHTTRMVQEWINKQPENAAYYAKLLKKFSELKNNLNKKSPNLNLFRNVLVVSLVAAYLAYLLTKEAGATIIGWCSDRDKIVETWGQIAHELFSLNHHALCLRDNIKSAGTKLLVSPRAYDAPWYDSINRIPDHLASTIASWSWADNTVNHAKHIDVLRSCFADNPFCSIVKISIKPEASQCSRIVVSKNPIQSTPSPTSNV
jgi:hypothetical protein